MNATTQITSLRLPARHGNNEPDAKRMLEDIVGSKWSTGILDVLRAGPIRPSALKRKLRGISTKVMNERLRMLTGYHVIERTLVNGDARHVEYQLSQFGSKFSRVLELLEELESELTAMQPPIPATR